MKGVSTVFNSGAEAAQAMADRLELRQCMVCGCDSGDEPLLPAGWGYCEFTAAVSAEADGEIAAFFCDVCAARLSIPENRNYGEGRN